jgi:vancomycin aglycone glucosyltransferase
MRIALAAEGTRGDVHPLLGLGAQLLEHGHEVVICAPPDFSAEAEALGLVFRPVGLSIRQRLQAEAAAFGGGNLRVLGAARRWFLESLPAQLAELPEATADVDCIVAGGVQVAAASAAELHGVAYRYVAYCPLLFPSPDHPPFLVPWQRLGPRRNRLLWRAAALLHDRAIGRPLSRAREAWGLAPVRDVLGHLLGPRPLLAADAELAPLPRTAGLEPIQVPCLHRPQLHRPGDVPLPPKLESFLETGPAPIYVGFGSMGDPDPARTTRCVLEAVAHLGCRAVLSAGWAGLGDLPLPEGVLRIDSVDHGALFPRVAAVVHHGGAGTTTIAARAGVPQLIVPHLLDQYYWAERVRALGLGPPPLPRRRLGAASLADALATLRGNEVLEERARQVGARLRGRADLDAAVAAVVAAPA